MKADTPFWRDLKANRQKMTKQQYRYASTDCNPGPYGLARPGGIDSRIHRQQERAGQHR